MSFELDIARMEEITGMLQDSHTSLDQSITLFEEGVSLAHKIEKSLAEMERKVELLMTDPNDPATEPLLEPFPAEQEP